MTPTSLIALTRRFGILAMLFGLLFTAGCDSSEDDPAVEDDAAKLVGVWNATSVKAGPLDILNIADIEMTLSLEENGDASIEVVDDEGEISGVSGTYSVDTDAGTITLDGDEVAENLVLDYTLVDDDNLSVSFAGSDLGNLGIDLGEVGGLLEGLKINVELVRDES